MCEQMRRRERLCVREQDGQRHGGSSERSTEHVKKIKKAMELWLSEKCVSKGGEQMY